MKVAFIGYSFSPMSPSVRLAKALDNKGINSKLIANESKLSNVQILKTSWFYRHFIRRFRNYYLNYFYWKKYPEKLHLPFSVNFLSTNPLNKRLIHDADIIHLDWIANSFVDLSKLNSIDKPLFWTLHDVWPVTGGCHCNLGCKKWETGCGNCPQLNSNAKKDASSIFWEDKKTKISDLKNLHLISPSNWLAEMARRSPILKNFPIKVIPNSLDTEIFKPKNKSDCKKLYHLNPQDKIILFGAANAIKTWYKGFDLLLEALFILKEKANESFHLVIFGAKEEEVEKQEIPIPFTNLGFINDELTLSTIYNLADVFVGPSRQDNFPNTFVEATSCGIPGVGFDVGGIPEIIDHKRNGYIAKSFDTNDLANGILWTLKDRQKYLEMSQYSRNKAFSNYSMDVVSKKHIEYYKSVNTQ